MSKWDLPFVLEAGLLVFSSIFYQLLSFHLSSLAEEFYAFIIEKDLL